MPNQRDRNRDPRDGGYREDEQRWARHRDDERRSVGSPGIGGGTGAARDQRGQGDDSWSPPQSAMERIGRGWGGRVGEFDDRDLSPTGERGHAGRGPMNYQRSDHRIHEDICDLLTDDDSLDASEIDVRVEHGEVTMTGFVGSRDAKRRAEQLADRVPGVKDIHNQIRLRGERSGASGMRS
jgi:hypothetical protein